MPALMRVLGGVTIRRGVATEGDAACLTSPQMNPVVADLHAFFAFAALRPFDRCDRVEMRTASVRHHSKSLFRVLRARNAVDEFEWFHHRGHGGHRDRQTEFTESTGFN